MLVFKSKKCAIKGKVGTFFFQNPRKCSTYILNRILHPFDNEFVHQDHLKCTLDVLHVDFSDKLEFAESCPNTFRGVNKYPDYDYGY